MSPPAFTRKRIARLCDDALRRSGALGVVPTPLEAVLEAAGATARTERATLPPRVLGAVWFDDRTVFVDRRQAAPRRRFTQAHEAAHLLLPWHAAALRVDTARELFGDLARGVEAEANFAAARLIFQGDAFHRDARAHPRSLATAFALADAYGASRHAAAHYYVEGHHEPVALALAGRWPGAGGALPVWRSIESASFRRRFGPLAACLPPLRPREERDASLGGAVEAARRSARPAGAVLALPDRGGTLRMLRAEVANNRHCHLVFVAEAARRPAVAAA